MNREPSSAAWLRRADLLEAKSAVDSSAAAENLAASCVNEPLWRRPASLAWLRKAAAMEDAVVTPPVAPNLLLTRKSAPAGDAFASPLSLAHRLIRLQSQSLLSSTRAQVLAQFSHLGIALDLHIAPFPKLVRASLEDGHLFSAFQIRAGSPVAEAVKPWMAQIFIHPEATPISARYCAAAGLYRLLELLAEFSGRKIATVGPATSAREREFAWSLCKQLWHEARETEFAAVPQETGDRIFAQASAPRLDLPADWPEGWGTNATANWLTSARSSTAEDCSPTATTAGVAASEA